ncbi:MAG: sigma-70 family RNA polymerase sigma factor [Pirellulaceae bacterium]|nr:sigma-70 family RNA polymerase sigma factor [Pirellulaceae bacterium]
MTATADGDLLLLGLSQHEAWLRTAVHSRLGNMDEVEEVMQEVALAAANQVTRNQPVERIGPWLYRVALRQVMLFRRKAGRRRKLLRSFQDRSVGRESASPMQFLLSQERQEMVRAAMGQLGELERQLLVLKYVEGLSYTEIADRVGATASSVQSRLHRARGQLRRALALD